jgi:hypothetical protein
MVPTRHFQSPGPFTQGMLRTTAAISPTIHALASARIKNYCTEELGVRYVAHCFLDIALRVTNKLGNFGELAFVGLGGPASVDHLNCIDSGAMTCIFSGRNYIVPGSERAVNIPLIGVGGRGQGRGQVQGPPQCKSTAVVSATSLRAKGYLVPKCPHNLLSIGTLARPLRQVRPHHWHWQGAIILKLP